MKTTLFILLLIATAPVLASTGIGPLDQAPTCYVTTLDGTSNDMKRLPDAAVSKAMTDDMTLEGSGPRTKTSFRYKFGDIELELTESAGCSMQCWEWRHARVTVAGVPFYTVGSKETLADRYPALVIQEAKQTAEVVCVLPSK